MLNSSKLILHSQDSFGCGKSLKWEYEALKAATKLNEKCEHLDIDNIQIKMLPTIDNNNYLCKCKVTCIKCDATFDKTTQKITEKFLRFYGK